LQPYPELSIKPTIRTYPNVQYLPSTSIDPTTTTKKDIATATAMTTTTKPPSQHLYGTPLLIKQPPSHPTKELNEATQRLPAT